MAHPAVGQWVVESLPSGGRTFCLMPLRPLVKISLIFFLASSSETPFGVERRFPEDGRALRVPLVLLDVKLRLVVLHRQRAFDDLVAVAGIVGLEQLLL